MTKTAQTRYRRLLDADGRLADLEVDRSGASPLLMLGRGGPAREEDALVPLARPESAGMLPVLIGAGMGYALKKLLHTLPTPQDNTPLVALVDREKDLREAAGINTDDPRLLLVDHHDPREALKCLSQWQTAHNGAPFLPLVLPFYQRLDRGYYGFLREQLEASRSFDFWKRARQPRFRSASPRLLLITSRYFLVGELVEACKRLDIEHRLLTLEDDEMSSSDFVAALLRHVVEFHPDAVLTFNHLGVDREGVLTDLLARLELPLASWFVDNPHLVLHLYKGLASPWLTIFTWDSDNIASLRAQGFARVFHLPLGTSPDRFRPTRQSSPPVWRVPVSFVGNSMVYKVAQRMKRTHLPGTVLRGYRRVAAAFAANHERSVRDFVQTHFPEIGKAYDALPDAEARLAYETLLTWESTRQYRTDCVRRLLGIRPGLVPLVVGDEGWRIEFRHENRPWRWHPPLTYYDELPRFYPFSDINFNTTSMQMKGAVNQRVFDVPAAGGFVLTDWREQIDELFEPGKEMVCYRHPDEIADLVRFYLDHPHTRRKIIDAARKRVLGCHTWAHRLRSLLATMKEVYGA